MIDILIRRRQNNPILTGEAGVGKTAVVEGFALRIAAGDVPPPLKNVALRTLDLGLLQAGAGVKGEFENRLKQVIAEVKASPTPIILFIDEAHTMIGAGGQAGQGDAANLLKPALARGELRTIAATTWAEYKKYFEKDAALARRFQVVKVEEPAEDRAIVMMRGHHRRCSRSTTGSASSTRRSRRRSSSRTATSPAGSCPTSRSACSTPPAPAWRSARTPSRPPSRTAAARSSTSRSRSASSSARRATGAGHDERLAEADEALGAGRGPAGRAGDALGRGADARRGDPRASATRSRPRHADGTAERRATASRAAVAEPAAAGRARRQDGRAAQAPGRDAADAGLRRLARRSPRSSPAGPASRSARWWPTRSRPS